MVLVSVFQINTSLLCRKGRGIYPTMSTILILVQRSHPQAANMARPMVTRRNTLMHNRTRANPADFRLDLAFLGLLPSAFGLLLGTRFPSSSRSLGCESGAQIPRTHRSSIRPTSASPSTSSPAHLGGRNASLTYMPIASPSPSASSSLCLSLALALASLRSLFSHYSSRRLCTLIARHCFSLLSSFPWNLVLYCST
jgi:hypothetical protein